jgi:hypothetical protein
MRTYADPRKPEIAEAQKYFAIEDSSIKLKLLKPNTQNQAGNRLIECNCITSI